MLCGPVLKRVFAQVYVTVTDPVKHSAVIFIFIFLVPYQYHWEINQGTSWTNPCIMGRCCRLVLVLNPGLSE